jgi:hypothetical protein
VGVGVGDTAEDGVILQKQLEAPYVDAQGHYQKKESDGDGNTAPGQGGGAIEAAFDQVGSAGHEQEEHGNDAPEDGQHQQPAGEGLPHRQREEVEAERAAEDRVGGTGSGVGLEPVQGEFRPVGHHGGCRGKGYQNGASQRDGVQHPFDRQPESTRADHEGRGTAQVRPAEAHQDPEPPVENEECGREEDGKDRPLEAEGLPENGAVAEGAEPESVHVPGNRTAAAQDDDGKKQKEKKEKTAAARASGPRLRHKDRIVNHGSTAFTSVEDWRLRQRPLYRATQAALSSPLVIGRVPQVRNLGPGIARTNNNQTWSVWRS